MAEIGSRFDPKTVIAVAGPPAAGYFALAAIPARCALERGDCKLAAQLAPRETPYPYTEAMTWFAHGLGSARGGQPAPVYGSAASRAQIREGLLKFGESYWALQVEIQELEVRAWATLADGKKEDALWLMESAAKLEDGTEKNAMTPGPLAPARELLDEMLRSTNQPVLALAQFEATLKKEPGRFRAPNGAGHTAELSDNSVAAGTYFRELLRICGHADKLVRPELQEAKNAVL